MHSDAIVQLSPFGFFGVHTPESQYGVAGDAAAHSGSLVHAPRQSPPEQPCGQVTVSSARHAPAPSQPAGLVLVEPLQLCARQLVVGPG